MTYTNLKVVVINNENIEKELFNLFSSIDADFTGENGEDYLWDDAEAKGFESNLEYCLDEAREEFGDDLEQIIKSVISSAQCTWDGYYSSWSESITKKDNEFIVALATSSN